MAGVSVPAARISAAAVEQGRRLRRRRRAATVVGAAALAAVIGVGVPQAIGSDGSDRSGRAATPTARGRQPSCPPTSRRAGGACRPARWPTTSMTCCPRAPGSSPMRTRSEEPGDEHREWEGFLGRAHRHPGQLRAGRHQPPRRVAGQPGAGHRDDRAGHGGRRRARRRAPAARTCAAPATARSSPPARCSATSRDGASDGSSRLDLGKVVLLTATLRMTDGGTVSIDASNSTDDKWGLGLVDHGRRAAAHPRAAPGHRRRPGVDELPPLSHGQHAGAGRLRRPAPGVLRPRRCPARRTPRRPGC